MTRTLLMRQVRLSKNVCALLKDHPNPLQLQKTLTNIKPKNNN
jgi:hypothetical protein